MKWLLCALFIAFPALASEKVIIYSQYDQRPFWYQGRGLTVDLAQVLTRKSQGRYQFEVQITPRKRIDMILQQADWQGLVPWSSPTWFNDQKQQKYRWSSTLFQDADLVISKSPLDYQGSASLHGKRLGGILGHRYIEQEAAIAAGKIIRDDAPTQESNLKKLRSGRVDVIFMAHSAWRELEENTPNEIAGLYIGKNPRNQYQRRLLISPNNVALIQFLEQAVAELAKDPQWQAKLYHYKPR